MPGVGGNTASDIGLTGDTTLVEDFGIGRGRQVGGGRWYCRASGPEDPGLGQDQRRHL